MRQKSYSLDRPEKPNSNNTGLGCILGGCGSAGCALLIGIPSLLIGGLGFLLFLTPIPINFIAGLIEEDNPNVQIDTISGNLLKGFSIPYVEFPDENYPDRINTLREINVLYPNLLKGLKSRELDFEEISVGSATLHVTYDSKTTEDTDHEGKPDTPEETSEPVSSDSGDQDWELFRLRKVDIKNIELIDLEKDFRFQLDELSLDGLEITQDHFQMGQLTLKSSALDFSMSPLDIQSGSGLQTSSKLKIDAKIQPNKELHVIQPIQLAGNIEFLDKGNVQGQIEGFDGKFVLHFTENKKEARLKVVDLTLADYFAVEPLLPSKINWDTTLKETAENVKIADTEAGTFYLGDALFTVQPGIPKGNKVALAVHKGDEDTLTLALHNKSEQSSEVSTSSFTLSSSNNPGSPQRDILADLYFDSKFEDLDLKEQNRILVTLGQPKKVE